MFIQYGNNFEQKKSKESAVEPITVYADGGCSGNPGPGAWAALIFFEQGKIEICGHDENTTNNRMELKAVIMALDRIKSLSPSVTALRIFTDSQYVKKGITEWIHKWIKNEWKNSAKDPVKNRDLWQEIYTLSASFSIHWEWIKGHAENVHNNECDRIVRQEIKRLLQK
jgi:ribonuclease HI